MYSAEELIHERGKAQVSHARAAQRLARILSNHTTNPEVIRAWAANLKKEFDNMMDKHVAAAEAPSRERRTLLKTMCFEGLKPFDGTDENWKQWAFKLGNAVANA